MVWQVEVKIFWVQWPQSHYCGRCGLLQHGFHRVVVVAASYRRRLHVVGGEVVYTQICGPESGEGGPKRARERSDLRVREKIARKTIRESRQMDGKSAYIYAQELLKLANQPMYKKKIKLLTMPQWTVQGWIAQGNAVLELYQFLAIGRYFWRIFAKLSSDGASLSQRSIA
jgi:hypothetical protein